MADAKAAPIESGEPPPPAPATFRPDYRAATAARHRRRAGATSQARAELVLDARAAGRFTGEVPEPRAGMRSGHIPGSASLPYTDLLNADGTFRSADAVRARLAQAGVDGTRPVVTSCGSGVTACILTLGLRLAGLPEGAVYDGSWTEWGGRSDTPVETKLTHDRRPEARLPHAAVACRPRRQARAWLRQSAAAARLHRAVSDGGRAPRDGSAARRAAADLRRWAAPRRIGRWRT